MGKSTDRTTDSVPSLKRSVLTGQTPKASKALPLSILYTEKFDLLDNGEWRKREPDKSRALFGTAPAAVELLNAEAASKFNVTGNVPGEAHSRTNRHVVTHNRPGAQGLTDNVTLQEGQAMPKEIIAVVRPKSIQLKKNKKGGEQQQGTRTDQESIVPDEMEMNLEVKVYDFAPPGTEVGGGGGSGSGGGGGREVYSGKTRAMTKQDVQGLYCFGTSGNQLEHLFAQMGTYMFHFSLLSSKYGEVPPAVVRVNVAPANANMCDAHCLEQARHRKRRGRTSIKHSAAAQGSGSVGGSVAGSVTAEEEVEDEEFPEPKVDMTHIHVTTLDEVVSVNGFFAIAVFLGLAFSPPLPQNQAATTLAPARVECYVEVDVYRAVVLWEVVSFSFFLFSTLVAHGFKLYIVLENGRDKDNSKFAEINHNFLRAVILSSAIGSILGAIFLIVSMVVLIEIRLGSLTCGNPWAMKTTDPFVVLGVSGCAIFIVAVFYESLSTSSPLK